MHLVSLRLPNPWNNGLLGAMWCPIPSQTALGRSSAANSSCPFPHKLRLGDVSIGHLSAPGYSSGSLIGQTTVSSLLKELCIQILVTFSGSRPNGSLWFLWNLKHNCHCILDVWTALRSRPYRLNCDQSVPLNWILWTQSVEARLICSNIIWENTNPQKPASLKGLKKKVVWVAGVH